MVFYYSKIEINCRSSQKLTEILTSTFLDLDAFVSFRFPNSYTVILAGIMYNHCNEILFIDSACKPSGLVDMTFSTLEYIMKRRNR